MARPAHPNDHDEKLRSILDAALHAEHLIPCPDLPTLKLIRSRLREVIRAHKVWNTGRGPELSVIRFKILRTHEVLPSRPNYHADAARSPFTLAVDARNIINDILAQTSSSLTSIPLTNSPSGAREDTSSPEYEFEEQEDLEDDGASADDYARIAHWYKKPKDPSS